MNKKEWVKIGPSAEYVRLGPQADVHFVFHRDAFRKYKIKTSKAKRITNANYITPPTT